MSRDELTEMGEVLAEQMAEVAADLPIRRQAVRAEVIAKVMERLEAYEQSLDRCPTYGHLLGGPDNPNADHIERHFINEAAEMVGVLVEIAMARGAGVPLRGPVEMAEVSPPPSTPESLGCERV